jgi:hypothetical protein
MSNHSGSDMLNDVLRIAKDMRIFESIGKDKACEFALELIRIGVRYDCNNGEILRDIGEVLGICYCCLGKSNNFDNGLCKSCR